MSESRGTKCLSYLLQCPVKRVLFPCDSKITVVMRNVKEKSELSKGKTTRLKCTYKLLPALVVGIVGEKAPIILLLFE